MYVSSQKKAEFNSQLYNLIQVNFLEISFSFLTETLASLFFLPSPRIVPGLEDQVK